MIEFLAIGIPVINIINEGKFLSWEVVTSPLVTVGILLLAVFLGKLFAAPFHIDQERQKEIDELKKLLPGELNIDIDVQSVFGMGSDSYDPLAKDGWMIVLNNARITNRSKENKVSLSFALTIGLINSRTGKDSWTIRQDDLRVLKYLPPQFLVGPLGIESQASKKGVIGFWIMSPFEKWLGGREVYDYKRVQLEITDHVSGRTLNITVSESRGDELIRTTNTKIEETRE